MNWTARIGAALILLLVLTALFAPLLAPHDPSRQELVSRLEGPSWSHPLGRDDLGRDVLSRLLYGARVSLLVALSATGMALAIGLPLGAVAGYYGGWTDELVSRILDVFLAFPGILLAIALVAVLQPGLWNVVIALGVIGWTGYARLIRGQVLKVRELDFVLSTRAMGAGDGRLLTLHILPNVLNPILVQATLGMAGIIIAEASLSFLGLGVAEPTASWGSMLQGGAQYLERAPHLAIFPGIAIMVTVLAFNFLGDGLRDWLDPRTGASTRAARETATP